MSLISSLEHAYAVAATDLVKVAKFVGEKILPELQKTNANADTVEAVTALVSPQAANIERIGFALLGTVIKTIQDAEAVGNAGGINLTLDAALIADIKSIIPAVKQNAVVGSAAVTTGK
jgi:hypothetical protein